MKTIQIYLEDEEYNRIKEIKGSLTWRKLLLDLTKKEDGENVK